MIQIRKSHDRGHADHGWLKTYHTFSFSDYQDPEHMQYRSLRVMNEDFVAPGQGFGTHPHRNMEIVTYVLEGALEHKDSMGNGEVLRPGEFQRMTAGSGITHSEFNPSQAEPVHLYQIWLYPNQQGLQPSYEQKSFPESERRNKLRLVASQDQRLGSLLINQDAEIYLATIDRGQQIQYDLKPSRYAWLQVLRGSIRTLGLDADRGDGLSIVNEKSWSIEALEEAEIMIFDLA